MVRQWADTTDERGNPVAGPEVEPIEKWKVSLTVSVHPEKIRWYAGTYKGKNAALARGATFAWEAYDEVSGEFIERTLEVGDEFDMKTYGGPLSTKRPRRVRVDAFDRKTHNLVIIFWSDVGQQTVADADE